QVRINRDGMSTQPDKCGLGVGCRCVSNVGTLGIQYNGNPGGNVRNNVAQGSQASGAMRLEKRAVRLESSSNRGCGIDQPVTLGAHFLYALGARVQPDTQQGVDLRHALLKHCKKVHTHAFPKTIANKAMRT